MALGHLQPQLAKLAPHIATLASNADALRRERHPWLGTAQWQRLRFQVITAALFTCAYCQRLEPDTSQLVADHIVPHRGDAKRFWDRANLQCLCAHCHNTVKQTMEGGRGGV